MATPLPRLLPLLLLAAACVVPPLAEETTPLGLDAPMMSPPGDLPAAERLAWWQRQVPRLSDADRCEAMLCIGELHLELREADDARLAFFDALGGELSAAETARAERGIGLSYFLDGRPGLGERRLRDALPDLEQPARTEIEWLLAASVGAGAPADRMALARMEPYLDAAGIEARLLRTGPVAGLYHDVSRVEWRAASMSANHDPMPKPWRITVHHSAMPLRGEALQLSIGEVRTIQRLHQRDRGWADVGYHFLIDRAGRVFEGRPLGVQGAHASGDNNRGNVGVCLLGNFVAQPELGSEYAVAQEISAAQWATLERLVGELCADFDIPAREVYTHKRFTGTECPGPALITWVRRYAAQGGSTRTGG